MDGLAADLPQNRVVEEALQRDSLEYGLANHYSQDLGCHFKQFLHMLVEVELIVSLGTIAQRKQVEFGVENLVYA